MKAQTMIRLAVQLERRVYSDYARIVDHVPVIPRNPRVEWRSGLGWYIDGKHERGTMAQIVDRYDERQRMLNQAIVDYRAGKLKVAQPEAQPGDERA